MNYQEIASDSLSKLKDTLATSGSDLTFDIGRALESENIILPVIGYVVVFASLLFLFIIFSSITKVIQSNLEKKLILKGEKKSTDSKEVPLSGELNAAIGMALYLHFNETHDFESTVLTIKKVQKAYSPWSSKIYGLREYPKN